MKACTSQLSYTIMYFLFMGHFALHFNVFVWITELLTIICTLEKVLNSFRGA